MLSRKDLLPTYLLTLGTREFSRALMTHIHASYISYSCAAASKKKRLAPRVYFARTTRKWLYQSWTRFYKTRQTVVSILFTDNLQIIYISTCLTPALIFRIIIID